MPKQAKYDGGPLDLSDGNNSNINSEDEDMENREPTAKKIDIKQSNRERRDKLNEFDFSLVMDVSEGSVDLD